MRFPEKWVVYSEFLENEGSPFYLKVARVGNRIYVGPHNLPKRARGKWLVHTAGYGERSVGLLRDNSIIIDWDGNSTRGQKYLEFLTKEKADEALAGIREIMQKFELYRRSLPKEIESRHHEV